jgi:hypothetical protein
MNVLKTLIIICLCFVGCWTFNGFLWFAYQIGVSVDFTSWYYHLSVIMTMFSCCINPFVYAAQYKQFQDGIRRMLRKLGRSKAAVPNISNTGIEGGTPMANLA